MPVPVSQESLKVPPTSSMQTKAAYQHAQDILVVMTIDLNDFKCHGNPGFCLSVQTAVSPSTFSTLPPSGAETILSKFTSQEMPQGEGGNLQTSFCSRHKVKIMTMLVILWWFYDAFMMLLWRFMTILWRVYDDANDNSDAKTILAFSGILVTE